MMFWLFAAVRWLSFARFDQSALKSMGMDAAVAFLAMALAYLAFVKGLPHLLDIAPTVRSALVSEPFHKLWWFINGPLLMSAIHGSRSSPTRGWLRCSCCLFFRVMVESSGVRDALLRTVLWIGLLLVSALPSLVVDFNDGSYRQYAAFDGIAITWLGPCFIAIKSSKALLGLPQEVCA